MVLNKGVKCFGVFLVLFIIFSLSLSGCSDVSALYTSDYGVRHYSWNNYECSNEEYDENHLYNSVFYGCQISAIVPVSSETTADADTVVYSGKLNLVKRINSQRTNAFYSNMRIGVRSLYFAGINLNLSQIPNVQFWITDWSNDQYSYQTLTIQWTIIAHSNSIVNQTGRMRVTFYTDNNNGRFDGPGTLNNSSPYYFENTDEDLSLYFIDTGGQSSDTIISQNNTNIYQNQIQIDQDNQYYQHEYNAEQNISNQSSSDIQGAENQQTTSIIGFLGGFLSSLQSVQPSNCSLTLAFPQFAGGSQTVNICSGKEHAPTIIAIAASMFLIGTFIPLAFVVLRMIYNEIRSWTNG